MSKGLDKLKLARRHLDRGRAAWDEPTDWDNLSLYGFYCLEATIEAAAQHLGLRTSKKHWEKADIASELHQKKGLPDLTGLLRDLNDARKAVAYGDIEAPELDPEYIAANIEEYVEAVAALLGAGGDDE